MRPDFEQMATSLYDAMGRGPEADIKCIAAALRLARAQAIEEAAGVATKCSEIRPEVFDGIIAKGMPRQLANEFKGHIEAFCADVSDLIRTLRATP